MRVNLERKKKILFKTKSTNKQPTSSSSSGWKGDEQYNTVESEWTYNEEAKIVNLVTEHLQT